MASEINNISTPNPISGGCRKSASQLHLLSFVMSAVKHSFKSSIPVSQASLRSSIPYANRASIQHKGCLTEGMISIRDA